jgi:hypothetical protein
MTTFQVITHPNESVKRTTFAEDDIESELLFSTREAGVAFFPISGDAIDEDDAD